MPLHGEIIFVTWYLASLLNPSDSGFPSCKVRTALLDLPLFTTPLLLFFMTNDNSGGVKLNPTNCIYRIVNTKSYVPLIVDLDRLNYDSWKELMKTHYIEYKVYDHLDWSSS